MGLTDPYMTNEELRDKYKNLLSKTQLHVGHRKLTSKRMSRMYIQNTWIYSTQPNFVVMRVSPSTYKTWIIMVNLPRAIYKKKYNKIVISVQILILLFIVLLWDQTLIVIMFKSIKNIVYLDWNIKSFRGLLLRCIIK